MKKILKKLFNCEQSHGGIKYRFTIFGIKILLPTPKSLLTKRNDIFYYYKKNNIDITTLPAATGQLRDIQLANLAILKEFDEFCRANNLSYWLEYGTLLGAVRHKGYIPWDDDIDVSMTREDYDKFIEIFEKNSPNSKLKLYYGKNNSGLFLLKLMRKDTELLFIDIFPSDYCKKHNSKEEKKETKEQARALRKEFLKNNDVEKLSGKELYEQYINFKKQNNIFEKKDETKEQDLMFGIEFGSFKDNFVQNYNNVFPLKEYDFEGYKFFCVSNADIRLKETYGENYMDYPPKLTYGHSKFFKLSKKDKEIIEELKKQVEIK